MIKRLGLLAKLGVLSFAATASMLPTAAAALPSHEQLVFYLDANGEYVGERLTTCDGGNYLTGSMTANIVVVYREPCAPPGPGGCIFLNGIWVCP